MILNWLKKINNKYPEFWKIYLGKFENKPTRFVVLSTYTSGLDHQKDVLVSMGAIAIVDNNIILNDAFEVEFIDSNVLVSENTILTNEEEIIKVKEETAIQSFVEYLGNAILVGHKIHFDVNVINEALDKMKCGRLKNEALDIQVMHKKIYDILDDEKQFSIDDLLRSHKLKRGDRHSCPDDAYFIALLFLKLKSRLGIS